MKNILFLISLFISICSFSQYVLTPDNFKDKDDLSKDYIVLDYVGKSQSELFNLSKQFINTYYHNPKFVSSEANNNQLVINALGNNYKMVMFNWNNEYQIELLFKDDKIKITPKFKWVKNLNGSDDVPLVIQSGYMWAVFNKKGKVMRSSAKVAAENDLNNFIADLKKKIESKKENW